MKRPENLFLVVAFLILAFSLFFWGESVIVSIFGFTAFIDGTSVLYFLILWMFVWWGLYRILQRYLPNKVFTWIHIIVTLAIVDYFLMTGSWFAKANASTEQQQYLYKQLMINRERLIYIGSVKGMICVLSQFIFVFNLIGGLVKAKRSTDV